ncbi:MAG TPA: FAD-dependent oxidoreductase [Candidatus Pacearchaeota archaeon]|nr:FAD-dependent oxidoreductase [Candidatus Pacearchaeota archaeon]
MKWDVAIIGAGPAGLTAGIYAARSGLKTIIISKDIGGTANSIVAIENWPGYKGSGAELMKRFYEHARDYDIHFAVSEVNSLKKKNNLFIIKTPKEDIECKTIIIATGSERKKLKIPGEEELLGRGVSYCATCDSFFFKNKIVGVIGGSDCATGSALALSDIAKKVYLIYRGEKLKCEDINMKNLEKKENVQIFYNSFPIKVIGKEKVEGIEIVKIKEKSKIDLDGIFIEIGSTPLTEFTKELKIKINSDNFIEVNSDMETSVKGVFACGDVTNFKLKQVVISASQGAIAAKSAGEFLNK